MNTMVMSVFERIREIGILRAIGWGRFMILRLILAEGLILCLLGGLLGVGLGVAGLQVLRFLKGFEWIQGTYSVGLFGESLVVALGMGLLGSIYPAIRAVRITPIEALRYE